MQGARPLPISPDYLLRSHCSVTTTKTMSLSCPSWPSPKARAPYHLCHTLISTDLGEAQLATVATIHLGQMGRRLHVESPVNNVSPLALSSSFTPPMLIAICKHQIRPHPDLQPRHG